MKHLNRFLQNPKLWEKYGKHDFSSGHVSKINISDEKNKNQGFSLIELIVVVAIMAVLVVILAPALLTYNERSRAERDNSAMDEVVNAVQLALADAQIYDEVVAFSTVDNISCYVDTDSEANYTRIVTKSNPDGVDQYTFDSTARQKDETPFYAAGNMRGVTITFAPDKGSNGSTFDFKQGVVNQYVQIKGNHRVGALQGLYGRIDSSVGESLEMVSQTYRNSEYTIFIRLGSTGGNDANMQNSIQTYGQWSGTNLPTEVSYQLVTDRSIGDPGNQIVEIDDSKWNSTNGTKITLKPGDLNGGGSFTPGTETGNKDYYTADEFAEDEKGIYAYLIDGNTLILRNSPRQDMSNVTKDYGILDANHNREWGDENLQIEYVDIETPILPKGCVNWFHGCENLIEIKNFKNLCMDECTTVQNMFRDCKKLQELDVSKWNTNNVTHMQNMFYGCSKLTELSVSNFNTAKVTNMNGVFYGCSNLTELDVSNFSTANVTTMQNMFFGCSKLTELSVSKFDTSNVTNMSYMFHSCNNLTELDVSNFDTAKVNTMYYMFINCKNLTKLDVSNFDTSNVTNMSYMFHSCNNLTELDVSGFDTAKVTTMQNMFQNCKNLTKLDVSNFDTSNVTNMKAMFYGCSNLTELDISNFDTTKVTTMQSMFQYCNNLPELDVSGFNTSKVTNMDAMFYRCVSLTVLDLSNFDTSNVTNIGNMFYDDKNLKSIHFGEKFNTSKVTKMYGTFWNCKNLINADVSNFDISNVDNIDNVYGMFQGCEKLTTEITVRGGKDDNYTIMFAGAATDPGAKITVNYTAETSDLVDAMIATKSANSNVVKGRLVE